MARPTKYKVEYCEMVIHHMANGLSKEAFAAEIDIHKDTLYEWIKAHKEFSDAVHIGEMKSLYFWEKAGIRGMDMGTKFNAIVWKFNIQNRFGWKEKQDITSDGRPAGIPILDNLRKLENREESEITS